MSLKRYRFTDKEKDDETGLYYFGVRYYMPWLGRWTAADPGGFVDGLNLYRYTRNNPVNGVDAMGYKTEPIKDPPEKEEVETIENNDPLGDAGDEITVTADAIEEGTDQRPKTIRDEEGRVIDPHGNVSDFAEDWYAVVEGNLLMTNGTDFQVWNDEASRYEVGREQRFLKGTAPIENLPYDQLQVGDIYYQKAPDPYGVNYGVGIFGDKRKLQYFGDRSWIELEGFKSVEHAEMFTEFAITFFPFGGNVGKLFSWLSKIHAGKKLVFAAKSIWKLPAKGPQSRGFVYEKMLGLKGLMKAPNFPTIDAFYKGVATSVKTMNLNAKSYQKGRAVYNTLKKYVDDLAKFKDTTWGGQTVRASDVKRKVLELGIPKGATKAQLEQLKEITNYAKQKGIKFTYRVVK